MDRMIRHYRLEEIIHEGKFSTVYRAHDVDLDIDVAIKELSLLAAGDPAASQRFIAEAKLAASLPHRHVVFVHTLFVEDGRLYIVMEYFPLGSLRTVVG